MVFINFISLLKLIKNLQKIVDNGMGSKNNLVSVKKSDFEVFQALAKDSEGIISSAQTEYSQVIPPNKPWEKVPGPPVLPPHLLQVILNKDTPMSVSIKCFFLPLLFLKLIFISIDC